MKTKTIALKGITMREAINEQGSIYLSSASHHFHVQRKTPGLALKYVLEGQEVYHVNGKTISVNQGQLLLLRNDVLFHGFNAKRPVLSKGLCINLEVNGDFDYSQIIDNDLCFNTPIHIKSATTLGKQLQFMSASHDHQTNFEASSFSLINETLQTLSNQFLVLKNKLSYDTKKTKTQQQLVSQLYQAKEFIYQNNDKKLSLDYLSRSIGISKFHFQRLFKKCFGISPLNLMHQLRMQKAQQLMKQQKQSLSAIALQLGYLDLASFSAKFKKEFGYPPSAYLKRLSNGQTITS